MIPSDSVPAGSVPAGRTPRPAFRPVGGSIDRAADRLVVVASIIVAFTFLVAALGALFLPEPLRRGAWLPLHLVLAGGASTAIAGVMPFFVAAFCAAPPVEPRLRSAAVAGVAAGAAVVSAGVVAVSPPAATVGGLTFLGGVGLVAVSCVVPMRRAQGPSRGLVVRGYLLALASLGVGAGLGTLYAAGVGPVLDRWSDLRLAHVWLNLVGFVSTVTATTLLHFFPTVIGARIANHRSARACIVGLGGGAQLAAFGFIVDVDAAVRAGALAVAAGALGLVIYAVRVWRTRARWTTDPGWHAFAMGGLVSAIGWFGLGIAVLVAGALVPGANGGPPLIAAAVPLAAGWIGMAVVASATHLIPAIGSGSPSIRARQRQILGRWARTRLVLANCGLAALFVGVATSAAPVAQAGAALFGAAYLATAACVGLALIHAARTRQG